MLLDLLHTTSLLIYLYNPFSPILWIVTYILFMLLLGYGFHKRSSWMTLAGGIPIVLLVIFSIFGHYTPRTFEEHFNDKNASMITRELSTDLNLYLDRYHILKKFDDFQELTRVTYKNNILIWHINIDKKFKTFIKKRIRKIYTDDEIEARLKNRENSLKKYSNSQIRNKLYKRYMKKYLENNLKRRFCNDDISNYLFSKGLRYQFQYTFYNKEPFTVIDFTTKACKQHASVQKIRTR